MSKTFACHRHSLFAIVLIPVLVVTCAGQTDAAADSLKPLLEALAKNKTSGSLEFTGRCESLRAGAYPEFPRLGAPATNEKSALDGVRYLFKDNPEMGVTQDADGTIRVVEHGVVTDILNLWLGSVSFGIAGVYGANLAVTHILAAPEVKRYMTAQNIEWPYVGAAVSILFGTTPPLDSTPHISGSITNVSVSQALDRILRVFPGVWIYENCPATDKRSRIVYVRFYRLQETGRGRVVQ
jgi:hypothetical protein